MINYFDDIKEVANFFDKKYLSEYFNGEQYEMDLDNAIHSEPHYSHKENNLRYKLMINKDDIIIRWFTLTENDIKSLNINPNAKNDMLKYGLSIVIVFSKSEIYGQVVSLDNPKYIVLNIAITDSTNYYDKLLHELMHIFDGYILKSKMNLYDISYTDILRILNNALKNKKISNDFYKKTLKEINTKAYFNDPVMRQANYQKKIQLLYDKGKISQKLYNREMNKSYYNDTIEVRARFIEWLENNLYKIDKMSDNDIQKELKNSYERWDILPKDIRNILYKKAILFKNKRNNNK